MADESDFIFVLVLGFVVLLYCILFFALDPEYRNNFKSGGHTYSGYGITGCLLLKGNKISKGPPILISS